MPHISLFYDNKKRLAYNPAKSGVALERRGIRRLLSFDDRFLEVTRVLRRFLDLTNSKLKMLDVGVGDAVYEKLLHKETRSRFDIWGIDVSKSQLGRSAKYLDHTKIVDLDSGKLPYKTESFDLILISEVLEHIFFPEKTLKEAHRVLKKRGHLIITYPNTGSLQLRLSVFFLGRSPLLNYTYNKEHIRFFDKKDILSVIGKDMKEVEYKGLGSLFFDKWNFPFKIYTPRPLQIIFNKYLPGLCLGNILVLQK